MNLTKKFTWCFEVYLIYGLILMKKLARKASFLFKRKLVYDKHNWGFIYKYAYNRKAFIFVKVATIGMMVGNTAVYWREKNEPTFKLANRVGVGIGLIVGFLGCFFYFQITHKMIRSIKLHKTYDKILI